MAIANETQQETKHMQQHAGHAAKYTLVWAALLVLTLLTVITGRMHLPTYGLLVALAIATVKGTLVALFFMHLAEHRGANRLVFTTSIVFVALMIGLSSADLGTRFQPALPPGSPKSELPSAYATDFLQKQIEENNAQGQHGGEVKEH